MRSAHQVTRGFFFGFKRSLFRYYFKKKNLGFLSKNEFSFCVFFFFCGAWKEMGFEMALGGFKLFFFFLIEVFGLFYLYCVFFHDTTQHYTHCHIII